MTDLIHQSDQLSKAAADLQVAGERRLTAAQFQGLAVARRPSNGSPISTTCVLGERTRATLSTSAIS